MNGRGVGNYRIFWPLTLVAVGSGLLLAQTGWFSAAALWRLAAAWPIFVILAGVSLIVRRYLDPSRAAVAVLAAFVLLCGTATIYAAAGPDIGGGTATVTGTALRGDLHDASLVVNGAAITLDVRVAVTGADLFEAQVTGDSGARAAISVESGNRVVISSDTQRWSPFGSWRSTTISVALNSSVGWDVVVNGAAVDGTVQLGGAARSLQVNTAAGDVAVVLDNPVGPVPLRFSGGGVQARVTVPTGVACSVSANGLASSVTVDGRERGAGVGRHAWADPGFNGATDRYELIANGASAGLTLLHRPS